MPASFNYGRFFFPSTAESWWQITNMVIEDGVSVSPRGLETRELIGKSMRFATPRFNYINPHGRNLNLPFAIVEFADFMLGHNPGNNVKFNSKMKDFINPLTNRFDGGYGSRIVASPEDLEASQFFRCLKELKQDKDSRRAVMTIHNNLLENWGGKDIACTLSLQFLIREDALTMITTMRSEDIFLGFCYDTFEFQLMQLVMAELLKVKVGSYYHNVGSLHFYLTDTEKLEKITPTSMPFDKKSNLPEIDFDDYEHFILDLGIINAIANCFEVDKKMDFNELMDMPFHGSSPYFQQCAIVVACDILRRGGYLDEGRELAAELFGEFETYFDRYGWSP